MDNKKKFDKTSFVMILIFAVIILGCTAALVFAAVNNREEKEVENSEPQTENVQQIEVKTKYDNFMDLSDKFFEICKAGDIDSLYDLYYDGVLEGMRLNMEDVPSKETFDAGLKQNMLSVTGFEEYEYGSMELPPTQTPGQYASYIFAMVNNGASLPFSASEVENCVNLVVFINNTHSTNHFMVKIGGYWYLLV